MHRLTLSIIVCLLSLIAFGQGHHPILESFSARTTNDEVVLDWVIAGGNTCNGIKIFHAPDTISFHQIGFIDGICGSTNSPEPYTYTHNAPLENTYNYYRLEFGGQGISLPLEVKFIKLGAGGYLIAPNPVSNSATIFFNNYSGEEYTFRLLDSYGREVLQITNIKDESFRFNRSGLKSGYYVFLLERKGTVEASGKIVVM